MLEVFSSGGVSYGYGTESAHQIGQANHLQLNLQKRVYFESALSQADAQEGFIQMVSNPGLDGRKDR